MQMPRNNRWLVTCHQRVKACDMPHSTSTRRNQRMRQKKATRAQKSEGQGAGGNLASKVVELGACLCTLARCCLPVSLRIAPRCFPHTPLVISEPPSLLAHTFQHCGMRKSVQEDEGVARDIGEGRMDQRADREGSTARVVALAQSGNTTGAWAHARHMAPAALAGRVAAPANRGTAGTKRQDRQEGNTGKTGTEGHDRQKGQGGQEDKTGSGA